MWCEHCQTDVATQIADDGQSLLCTACGTTVRKVFAPSLHPQTKSAREILERWAKEQQALKQTKGFDASKSSVPLPERPKPVALPEPAAPIRKAVKNIAENISGNAAENVTDEVSFKEAALPFSAPAAMKKKDFRFEPATAPPVEQSRTEEQRTEVRRTAESKVQPDETPEQIDEQQLISEQPAAEFTVAELPASEALVSEPVSSSAEEQTTKTVSAEDRSQASVEKASAVEHEEAPLPKKRRIDAEHITPVQPVRGPRSSRRAPAGEHEEVQQRRRKKKSRSADRRRFDAESAGDQPSAPKRRMDSPEEVLAGPHFDVPMARTSQRGLPGRAESIWGQLMAYVGVGLLSIGTVLVLWGYFGDIARYASTGWLIATSGQMLLLLGVVTLVSGGMQQTTHEVSQRIDHIGGRIIRIEQSTDQLLKSPHSRRKRTRRRHPEDSVSDHEET